MEPMYTTKQKKLGVTAIEVVIGVSIAALVLVYVTNAVALFVNAGRVVGEKTKAIYLAEDGLELLRYVRDGSWNAISGLSSNTTYYLNVTPTGVYIVTTPQLVDSFTRSFRVSNVYRNTSDDIVSSTTMFATVDSGSKYITMTVTDSSVPTSVSIMTLLTELDP